MVSDGLAGLLWVIPLGLCYGSFATAMIARIPSGRSWISSSKKPERSACPHCGHVLGVLDLIPLLSWLCLRGRCRHCQHPIGGRYPLTESATLLLTLAVYAAWGASVPGLVLMLAIPFVVAMLVIDLEHMILPDQLQVILFVLGIIFVFFQAETHQFSSEILMSFGASAVFFLLAYGLAKGGALVLKREALGMGDVKFFAVAGLWLGLMALPAFLLLGGCLGVLLGLVWRFFVKQDVFPFGPALIIAFLVLLLFRGPLISPLVSPFLGAFPGLF